MPLGCSAAVRVTLWVPLQVALVPLGGALLSCPRSTQRSLPQLPSLPRSAGAAGDKPPRLAVKLRRLRQGG